MKKLTLIVLVLLVLLSAFVSSACNDNPCANGSACGLTAPAGDLQNTVTEWVKDTCNKDAAGNCMTMGQ